MHIELSPLIIGFHVVALQDQAESIQCDGYNSR